MDVDPKAALARLRDAASSGILDELCARHHVHVLTVFGGAVRGDGENPQDLDVAVAFAPGSTADIVGLATDLGEVAGSSALDLMDLGRAGPVARERALVGCVPLYEAEPGAFARRQMAAILEFMDTAWLRRLDLEAMAG